MKITKAYCAYEPEKFISSFGFKGKTLSGVWQTSVLLCSEKVYGLGLGVQSVLWSDGNVFAEYGEDESNMLMYKVTCYALKLLEGKEFNKPQEMIKAVFNDCLTYAKEITKMQVTETFVLNALVPVDLAAWQLWAKLNNVDDFDEIYKGSAKSTHLANIPLITYGTSVEKVLELAQNGVCLFKIKIGSDPEGDGDPNKMIEWDKKRMVEIHKVLSDVSTPYTESRKVLYYFDANGRYQTKAQLTELVNFMVKEGIAERTVLFEEPFAPENEIYVGDIPVVFAADESAHSLADVERRIELGYKAITLKPIAKTLSVTMEMADCADKHNVACFCADLTVNPVMVEWNKNVAARLKPLKGMKIGVVESNGAQNYINWKQMKERLCVENNEDETVYNLENGFYSHAGGIFKTPEYYLDYLMKSNNIKELE